MSGLMITAARIGLAVLLILCVGPSRSIIFSEFHQSDQSDQHEVTVTLKLIQVYVTDNEGNPVRDLSKQDFVLYDNGEQKTITEFEKHFLIDVTKDKKEVRSETQTEPPRKVAADLSRKFIVILDFYQSDVIGVQRSKTAAAHFIETQLHPSDEVAIFSYSPFQGFFLALRYWQGQT